VLWGDSASAMRSCTGCMDTGCCVLVLLLDYVVEMGSGLAAGSLAVEVCCGVIQHPQGVHAPAACHDAAASSGSSDALPLGPVPHMIRRAS
jgi:hypothetical protein